MYLLELFLINAYRYKVTWPEILWLRCFKAFTDVILTIPLIQPNPKCKGNVWLPDVFGLLEENQNECYENDIINF